MLPTRLRTIPTRLALGVLLLHATACGKAGKKPSAADKAAAQVPKASELVDYDLSKAGPQWKGWVAKGPKGCRVMKDLGDHARLACKGPDIVESSRSGRRGFDLVFVPKKQDLAAFKKRMAKRFDRNRREGAFKVLSDQPDLFAWREGKGKFHGYFFVMNRKVGDREVSCQPNLMLGGGIPAEHQLHLAACRTLRHQ